LKKEIYF